MVTKTDDPLIDFERNESEQYEWLQKRPTCSCCGEHISDDYAVYIDNEWICDRCIDDMRRYIGDE